MGDEGSSEGDCILDDVAGQDVSENDVSETHFGEELGRSEGDEGGISRSDWAFSDVSKIGNGLPCTNY